MVQNYLKVVRCLSNMVRNYYRIEWGALPQALKATVGTMFCKKHETVQLIASLKGLIQEFYRGFIMLCLFYPFLFFFHSFWIFDFFIWIIFHKIRASVLRKTRRIDPRTPEGPIP